MGLSRGVKQLRRWTNCAEEIIWQKTTLRTIDHLTPEKIETRQGQIFHGDLENETNVAQIDFWGLKAAQLISEMSRLFHPVDWFWLQTNLCCLVFKSFAILGPVWIRFGKNPDKVFYVWRKFCVACCRKGIYSVFLIIQQCISHILFHVWRRFVSRRAAGRGGEAKARPADPLIGQTSKANRCDRWTDKEENRNTRK